MIRITIEPIGRGRYRATCNGRMIVASSRQPECDTARVLIALGHRGMAETWRPGTTAPAMRFSIERMAALSVEETVSAGPRLVRYRPLPAVAFQDAVSASTVSARTGV